MRRRRMPLIVIVLAVLVIAALIYYFAIAEQTGQGGMRTSCLRINEVMTSNKGSVPGPAGNYPDWVEIYNDSDSRVDFSGYGLTDDKLSGAKWAAPSGTAIEPHGYLVIYCSGNVSDGGLSAGFKLSATDDLVLLDPSGRAVDSLALMEVPSGSTLGRDAAEGAWVTLSEPSPGYENTAQGAQAFRDSLQAGAETVDTGVVINEIMPSNGSTLVDRNGNYSDWIELYNKTDGEIDLTGYGLSDDLARPMRWQFPEGTTLPAHGYLVVFLSGESSTAVEEELHAPFGLRAYGEDVVLTSPTGSIVDSYTYSRAETDVSFARSVDGTGEFASSAQPTPGYPNTAAGYQEFESNMSFSADGPVIISEMLTLNDSSVQAADGGYYDWIELYNRSSETVSLAGWALTDTAKNPAQWVFPEDASIGAGEYMVILASGNDVKDTKKKYLETNFSLAASGDGALLYNKEGSLADKLTCSKAQLNVSVGRDASGIRLFYETCTPGTANGNGLRGITTTPQLLTVPGVFDAAVTLELSAGAGETIYYTTDCTTPTAASKRYDGPITLSSNTVIRAVAVSDGYITGPSVTGTYLFTSDKANHSLPIATLVTDPDNLWDSKTGIYATGENFDPDLATYGDILSSATYYQSKFTTDKDAWERPAAFSIFDNSGAEVFSQNVGIRIAGSFGRGRAQKGFNIIARDDYGADRMAYAFFDNRDFTEYKALVLRAGAQDQNRSKIRDELATGLLEGMDVNVLNQAYKPYVLYLNGEYWGVYFLKEKRNRFFVAQHEGIVDAENMVIGKGDAQRNYGDNAQWNELRQYITSHDLSVQSNFDYVAQRMDVNSFMDYMICEIYTGNTDTYNSQYYKLPDGKWTWIYYDFCWGFNSSTHESLTFRRGKVAHGEIFNALLKNAQWRDAFLRRFAQLLKTAFAPERVLALIDELYAAVEPEMAREREKFNQSTFMGERQPEQNLGTYDGFVSQVEFLRKFAGERPAALKAQLQKEFGLSDSYMQEVFG